MRVKIYFLESRYEQKSS